MGVARGFCAFGYWSDRNRGDVECCRYPTDSEEGYERIFELLSKGKYEEMYAFVSDTSGIEKKAFLEKKQKYL